MRLLQVAALTCIALIGALGLASADDYPTRPITLIVPFPPGGSTTVMARNVADKMSAALGQQIVVDNRGGAGGTLGTRFVAKAAPDGYTILLSYTATMAIAPAMNANAGYDPGKDFAPIGMIGFAPSVLVVHPSMPGALDRRADQPGQGSAVAAAIRLARRRHGQSPCLRISCDRSGHQASSRAVQRQRPRHQRPARRTYSDDVPADPGCARQHQGRHPARARHYQRETIEPAAGRPDRGRNGVPGFEVALRYGLAAPAGTPRAIIARLNKELNAALAAEDVKTRLATEGAEALPGTPEIYAADIAVEEKKYGGLVKKLGLKVE